MSEKNIGERTILCDIICNRHCKSYLNLLIIYIDKTKDIIKYELDGKFDHTHSLIRVVNDWNPNIKGSQRRKIIDLVFKLCQLTGGVIPEKVCKDAIKLLNQNQETVEAKEKGKEIKNVDEFVQLFDDKQDFDYCLNVIQQYLITNNWLFVNFFV